MTREFGAEVIAQNGDPRGSFPGPFGEGQLFLL